MKKRIRILMFGMLVCLACFFNSPEPVMAMDGNVSRYVQKEAGTDDGTGVVELDESINRGTMIIVGICRALGAACGMVGMVLAFIGFFGHQQDLKAQAPIFIFVGVGIFFAPEIFNFLVGR